MILLLFVTLVNTLNVNTQSPNSLIYQCCIHITCKHIPLDGGLESSQKVDQIKRQNDSQLLIATEQWWKLLRAAGFRRKVLHGGCEENNRRELG